MFPDHARRENRFERISYAVSDTEVAIQTQGGNLDADKVRIALEHALALWGVVAPVDFRPAGAGEEPVIRIRFTREGASILNLGNTSGHVDRTPTGTFGSASIRINCDNDLFVDRFFESDRHATQPGPFDLVSILAHEVGHALGIEHPPVDPATGRESEGGVMSDSVGTAILRHLLPYDVREVQAKHGALLLAEAVRSNLAATGHLIDASGTVSLQVAGSELVVTGAMGSSVLLDVLVPARHRWANALRLGFTLVTSNVLVNRVTAFDGIAPVQELALSARAAGGEGLRGRRFDLRLGFLRRPRLRNDMLVRLQVFFTNREGQPESEFGVLQLHEVAVETLPLPIEVNRGVEPA